MYSEYLLMSSKSSTSEVFLSSLFICLRISITMHATYPWKTKLLKTFKLVANVSYLGGISSTTSTLFRIFSKTLFTIN